MKCDIIIPVWNELQFTKECIDSIIKNTHYPYRLIIIDNGSEDETKAYLEALKERKDCEVTLIRNEENLGFVKAVNQGIRISDAQFVCLLNNDTIVTRCWLEEMINIAQSNPQIGLVNPSSNTLGQRPDLNESIETFALRLKAEKGKWTELGCCTGFCMLIKRELIENIGYFDECFGMGNFEDTDFSRRAFKAGYICVRTKAAYVYHQEKASFKKCKGRQEAFRRNQEIFYARWGRPKRILYVVNKQDNGYYQRIKNDSINLAKKTNWVWIFLKNSLGNIELIEHSNIVLIRLPDKFFNFRTIWKILKRKKKFDEIFSDDKRFNNILKRLRFIHKADLKSLI